jgi:probable F420-dependent oxidoreductase
MKIGLQGIFAGQDATAQHMAKTAQLVEEANFYSLWMPEHVLLFEDYDSPYPYSKDGKAPVDPHNGIVEPFTALSFLAGHTSRVRLGTGITILPQRNPVYFAKQAADVDVISGGRLDIGIGVGWLAEEFAALGVPFERRGARAADYLKVCQTLWCDDVSQYDGEFYTLPTCVQGPKPVQKPYPPLWFGGESTPALRRVARFGQGWYGVNLLPEDLPPHVEELSKQLDKEGRKLADVDIAIAPYGKGCDLDMLKRYRDLGVDQVILFALTAEPGKLYDEIKRYGDEIVAPGADI